MARPTKQHIKAGIPERPANLSPGAAAEWDRLMLEFQAAGIAVSQAHRALIAQAATLAADIADAWEVIQIEGAYVVNEKNGSPMMHPAAQRIDRLRRDYLKVIFTLGLRGGSVGDSGSGPNLDAVLNG